MRSCVELVPLKTCRSRLWLESCEFKHHIDAQSILIHGHKLFQKPSCPTQKSQQCVVKVKKCVFLVLPATCVAQDCQGIWEAIQVVVSEVQYQRLAGFPWDEAPRFMPALKVRQNRYPLQHITYCTSTT